ncbi:MerR family transcriptional regulator [Bacillus mycoides]|uniref:MerR family transcriptional regulator n=1 Tax=Bacillus mycoides TaxID=1405 RepID=UPI003A80DD86
MVNALEFGCIEDDGNWSRLAELKNLMNVDGMVALRYAKIFEGLGREITRNVSGIRIYSDEDVRAILKLRDCERNGENVTVAAERIIKELQGATVLVDDAYGRYSRSAVAERLGVRPHTVTNHTNTLEKKGYMFKLVNGRNKVYSEKDINIIQQLMDYNDEGMKLQDAAEKIMEDGGIRVVSSETNKVFRLRVVADILGLDKDDILRYMTELERGGFTVERNKNGIRLYTAKSVRMIHRLRELKEDGMQTGSAVVQIIKESEEW